MTEHVLYGIHAVTALLNNPYRQTHKLCIKQEREDKRLQAVVDLACQKQIAIETMSLQIMNQRFNGLTHQGIVAFANALPDYNESHLQGLLKHAISPKLILILDGITDPHNLGACLRTADAAGVNFIIIPKDKSASITPVVSKVACGAVESVPLVRVTNLVRVIEYLKQEGIWIYGAASEALQTIYEHDFKTSTAIILGAEGAGLRRLTREHCDNLFALPMAGSVKSLNVSVATGIALYEVVRQRRMK